MIGLLPPDSEWHLVLLTMCSLKHIFLLDPKTPPSLVFLLPSAIPWPVLSSPPPLPKRNLSKEFRTISASHSEIHNPSPGHSSEDHTSLSSLLPGWSKWNSQSVPTKYAPLPVVPSPGNGPSFHPETCLSKPPALFHIQHLVHPQVLLITRPQSTSKSSLLSMLLPPSSSRPPTSCLNYASHFLMALWVSTLTRL